MRPKWEYETICISAPNQVDADVLNDWGADGWELAAVLPMPNGYVDPYCELIFKRPVAVPVPRKRLPTKRRAKPS